MTTTTLALKATRTRCNALHPDNELVGAEDRLLVTSNEDGRMRLVIVTADQQGVAPKVGEKLEVARWGALDIVGMRYASGRTRGVVPAEGRLPLRRLVVKVKADKADADQA